MEIDAPPQPPRLGQNQSLQLSSPCLKRAEVEAFAQLVPFLPRPCDKCVLICYAVSFCSRPRLRTPCTIPVLDLHDTCRGLAYATSLRYAHGGFACAQVDVTQLIYMSTSLWKLLRLGRLLRVRRRAQKLGKQTHT